MYKGHILVCGIHRHCTDTHFSLKITFVNWSPSPLIRNTITGKLHYFDVELQENKILVHTIWHYLRPTTLDSISKKYIRLKHRLCIVYGKWSPRRETNIHPPHTYVHTTYNKAAPHSPTQGTASIHNNMDLQLLASVRTCQQGARGRNIRHLYVWIITTTPRWWQ